MCKVTCLLVTTAPHLLNHCYLRSKDSKAHEIIKMYHIIIAVIADLLIWIPHTNPPQHPCKQAIAPMARKQNSETSTIARAGYLCFKVVLQKYGGFHKWGKPKMI